MNQNTTANEESIDKRTKRAATESMTVVDLGEGEYKVYSGSSSVYEVNLVNETCDCPAAKYQEGTCKHVRRIELEAGLREIPDLDGRTDVEIMRDARNRCETETEPAIATDGGAIVEPQPQGTGAETTHAPGCDDPDCEGLDADADRPVLSFACWEEWAAYDEEDLIVRLIEEVNLYRK